MARPKTIKFDILESTWTAKRLSDAQYLKQQGPGSAAICHIDAKHFVFNTTDFTLQTIIHELCHGYIHQLNYNDLDLSEDQVEEFICEMVAKYGPGIINKAAEIYKLLGEQ